MLFILFILFILFAIMFITRASNQYELDGARYGWAIGITSFALVVAATYGGAWLTEVAISFAAQYIEIFRELIRQSNDPTIGEILSILVAAPTTILAVVVIPKWTFHLAAHGKLKSDNNQPSQNTTKTKVLAAVCVLIAVAAGVATISLLNYDQTLGQTEIQPLPELEITKPLLSVPIKPTYTSQPPPTYTPAPVTPASCQWSTNIRSNAVTVPGPTCKFDPPGTC